MDRLLKLLKRGDMLMGRKTKEEKKVAWWSQDGVGKYEVGGCGVIELDSDVEEQPQKRAKRLSENEQKAEKWFKDQ